MSSLLIDECEIKSALKRSGDCYVRKKKQLIVHCVSFVKL